MGEMGHQDEDQWQGEEKKDQEGRGRQSEGRGRQGEGRKGRSIGDPVGRTGKLQMERQ